MNQNNRISANVDFNSTHRFVITSTISEQGLLLRISIMGSSKKQKRYQAFLSSLDIEKRLSQYFQTFQQLADYVKDQENAQVDLEKGLLNIMACVNSRKTKHITLASLPIQEAYMTPSEQLQSIIQRCEEGNPIQDGQLKIMLTKLAKIMLEGQGKEIKHAEHEQIKNQFRHPIQNFQKQKIKLEMKKMQERFNKKIYEMQNVLTEIEQRNEKDYHLFKDHVIELDEHVCQKMNQKITEISSNFVDQDGYDRIIDKIKLLGHRIEQSEEKFKIFIGKNVKKWVTVNPASWIDNQCNDFNKLQLTSTTITAKQDNAIIYGKPNFNNKLVFSVNIIKMTNFIGLGFADTRYKSGDHAFDDIFRYFNDGICWIGSGDQEIKSQNKFKQGDTVQAYLDRKQATIEWKIGSEVKLRLKNDKISNRTIDWAPYIEINQKFDIISVSTYETDE